MPSQERAPTTASPSHVPLPHGVPEVKRRHAPAPSHVPSKPHVEASVARQPLAMRGFEPAEMTVHVPIEPEAPHVLQDSVQAELQHRPSTQKLLEHSALHPQACPLAFFVRASLQAASEVVVPGPSMPVAPAAPSCALASPSLFELLLPPQPAATSTATVIANAATTKPPLPKLTSLIMRIGPGR